MKRIARPVVAFLYNERSVYPDPERAATQVETDFDDRQTIEAMSAALEGLGLEVLGLEADEHALPRLYEERRRIHVALNYSMGRRGAARYAQFPAVLELLGIPYTGSDPLVQGIVQDKARMQALLAAEGIGVPWTAVIRELKDLEGVEPAFPLLVKPGTQGSSAGITSRSLVRDPEALRRQVEAVLETFGPPVLVQRFLAGREFSVPILGDPPRVLPIVEPDFARLPQGYPPFDTLEVKWYFEEQCASNHLVCPARVDRELQQRIEKTVLGAWKALGLRDWCRIDLRADESGRLHVLDVNSPPGMIPPSVSQTSYLPLAGRAAGLAYEELLAEMLRLAARRGGLSILA